MEKINLNALYKEAMEAKILAAQEKARIYVEKDVIPYLVETAKSGDTCAKVQIPSGVIKEYVREYICEKIEYTTMREDCRCLTIFWG